MSDPEDGDGGNPRVAEEDLVEVPRRRVAVERSAGVEGQGRPEGGQGFKKLDRLELGVPLGVGFEVAGLAAVVLEGAGDLDRQPVVEPVDQVADVVADISHVQILAPAVTGVEDLAEVLEDLDDLAVARQGLMAEVVDPAAFLVRLDQPLGERRERFFQRHVGCHPRSPLRAETVRSAGPPTLYPPTARRQTRLW